ncbi:hypothetical protein B296_00053745 [Ensete ventricosum]|uniref:Uncharacterized protein n=1 Tax=Ensete ventricosum TaxID=4639 RepID=A0A426X0T0_ENSVE|nr:hypothetical protein B296_00053745 [Ensete ventricosum]
MLPLRFPDSGIRAKPGKGAVGYNRLSVGVFGYGHGCQQGGGTRPRPCRRGSAHSRPARKGQCLPPFGPQRGDANIGTTPAREVPLEGSDNYRRGCRQQHATLPLT